jgi:c-di-GMP-binding flagellar brake protein YcgR
MTQPSAAGEEPDAFRVTAPEDIVAVLRRLVEGDVPVTLRAAGDAADPTVYATAVWAEDVISGLVVLSADGDSAAVQALVAAGHAQAMAQLDNVEVRFPLARLALVKGRDTCALNAAYPVEMQRFQRRDAYRVRPLDYSHPVMHLRRLGADAHTQDTADELSLPVLDMSHGGMSLRLADDQPAVAGGTMFDGVLELDGMLQVKLRLRVARVAADGRQLGCEITEVAPQDARALQRYIDHTQRRRRMLML